MSDVLGNVIKLTLFGESHSSYIGATISSLPSGIKINHELIKDMLCKRKTGDEYSSSRLEDDDYQLISGVFNDFTTGSSLTVLMKNKDVDSSSYHEDLIRPSHADYTSKIKYQGYNDYRGGGHLSGRLTAPIVVIGAIIISYLQEKGIKIGTRILNIHGINDEEITSLNENISSFNQQIFPTVSNKKAELMKKEILKAKENGDSVGGQLETYVLNLKEGIGNPYFDSLESIISHSLFSIPGVKGVEFGLGTSFKDYYGSEINDEFAFKDNKVITTSNNNGGINGGISNGMPIVIKTTIKPTPSISKKQHSISLKENKNITLEVKGRHDPCIVRRAIPVVNSLVAFSLLDSMFTR